MLLPCKLFLYAYFFGVTFFSCVVSVLFCFTIAKLVIHFFCLFNFCTLHSGLICVVHNYLCVWLHFFLHSGFLCAIACLPYFLQGFCASHFDFLLPKCSLLYFFVFLQVFAGATSSFSVDFLPFCRPFRYFGGFCSLSFYGPLSFCACLWIFYVFLANSVTSLFFAIYARRLTYLRVLVLLFRFASPFLFLLFH